MPSTLYTDILRQAGAKHFKYGDVELRDWFRDKALQLKSQNVSTNRLIERASAVNRVAQPTVGKMLMYRYDPKHKLTLPYYDTFPVIFPIESYSDGWLGLNMHYLPPIYRARLMDALYDTLNNQKYDDTTKLQISYKMLSSATKFKYFKPCVKRYLRNHVRSELLEVDITEWDYIMFLPLARFKKNRARTVWDQSIMR